MSNTEQADITFAVEAKKFVMQALLEKASSVLPSKDILPVLKNFQIEAQADQVRVIATDLELSVVATTEMVSVLQPGMAVFPGKAILEIVKEAEDGDMVITVRGGDCHIEIGRTTWDLLLMDGSEYPPLPDLDEMEFHEINRPKFFGGIQQVRYAAATDTVRPALMMIDISDNKMRAADGVRFQQVEIECPIDIQIPIGAVDDLLRLLRTSEQQFIDLGESDNHIVFRVGGDTFIANKLTAVFPNVEEILLKPALRNNQELHIDRADLVSAIKRVRVTADAETSAIILHLEANKCTVRSRDKFGNQAQEILDCSWATDSRDVALNHTYMMDMLNMHDAKSCDFFLGMDTKTRKSPLMLKDEESGLVGILNQVRVEFLTGASAGDSDFRKRAGGDYSTGRGSADSRHNAANQFLKEDEVVIDADAESVSEFAE